VNRVLITGRLTRDPEMRTTASGKSVTTFTVATNEYAGNGKEKAEYHPVVTWDRLAEICGRYLGKGQQVAIEGRLQTRSWDDDRGQRHWKTEIVAAQVEMLSGRNKRDYAAESAADALALQASQRGLTESDDDEEEEDEEEAAGTSASEPMTEDEADTAEAEEAVLAIA
jgi:single-strand DNA-binding protein